MQEMLIIATTATILQYTNVSNYQVVYCIQCYMSNVFQFKKTHEKEENPSWLQVRLLSSTFIIFPGCRAIIHKHINTVEAQAEFFIYFSSTKQIFIYLLAPIIENGSALIQR